MKGSLERIYIYIVASTFARKVVVVVCSRDTMRRNGMGIVLAPAYTYALYMYSQERESKP